MELPYSTIKETSENLKKKMVSVVELTKSYLKRIETMDQKLHAFLTINEKGALVDAQKADNLIATIPNIFETKPLLGIPVAAKDLYSTKDLRTTAGSKVIENYIPPFDATVIKKYKDAGAILVGKTNEDAWGHGSSGENSDYEPARNPYDFTRVPGGSSSGSGAAVASGECLAATGTDTGSSVRLPAAFCNLVGLKPTYGRVSRYGIMAMASSFDTIGHMTHTVYDNAKVLEVTAGRDPYDATSSPLPVPKYTSHLERSVKRMKIGIPKEYFVSGIEAGVSKVTQEALDTFKKMGAIIEEVSLPHTDVAMACYYILVPSEVSSNLARFDGVRFGEKREVFGAEAKRRIMLGAYTLSSGYYDAYYLKAAKVRRLIKQDFEEVLQKVDVIVAPSSPSLPFKMGEKADDPLQMYLSDIFLCPINLAGVPSLNVPCGFVGELPVGLQIIGPHFKEELLYQVGHQFEKETEFYKKRPVL
ncbi:MAG: Asp-tRNA(Asn)/Glu-tRNA(Gln) amidotransferase GatCAB subunit A [Candidatus Kerfeldbacteria bacterium CG08_land_8_20_14_0_20_42_7]|uniref:Glutamyl-tRNA(Gln) amidotransferase subunit A n=2 Tax=Patescibacteria group TaxID=1783273 RepID=A0A2H0YRE3_9BACT|nr:MAG: Asp-tRNA(Asn)/Glu-tRNA(Gln) amidotransferase GatCAB subunit A [Candidatus Kerfeldbacteria bacterium CG08_land_8_20_14_0_20_42_7]